MTVEERLAALEQAWAALQAQTPTSYYTSRHGGEEIDKGIDRAKEGGAIDAALAGKVSNRGYIGTDEFNDVGYNYPYTASIGNGVIGAPEPNFYTVLYLPFQDTPGYATQIVSNVNEPGRLFLRQSTTNGIWEPWIPIATATPPQEIDLPLAEGWYVVSDNSSLILNQFGRIFFDGTIAKSVKLVAGELIFTLPPGYYPKAQKWIWALSLHPSGNSIVAIPIVITTDGLVKIDENAHLSNFSEYEPGWSISLSFSFQAAAV